MYVVNVACQISSAIILYYNSIYCSSYVFTTRMNVIAMPVPSMYARGKLLRDSAAAGVQSTYIHLST